MVAIIAGVFLYTNYSGSLKLPEGRPRSIEKSTLFDVAPLVSIGIAQAVPYGWVSLVNSGDQAMDVTSWKIQANAGSFIIPKAVEVYHPSGLSPDSNIVMQPGDRLYIYPNRSPIGRNFMINKCIGYLENEIVFEPPLPLLCPRIDPIDIIQLSGACQSYLLSLRACEMPEPNIALESDYYCAQKFRDLNYRGCFDKYGSDEDFFTGEWRIWGSGSFLDPQHDLVRLINKQGLIVDDYIY